MYYIDILKEKIKKEGLESTIRYLLSDNLPLQLKSEMEKEHIFNDGYLCLSLIYALE